MDRTVARLNIERYERLLAEEVDEARRQVLLRLIAEEVAKVGKRGQPGGGRLKT
jgi:hypothetical protein